MKDEHERPTANFLRGLTLGAIIGAVIAGSRIWARSRPYDPVARTPAPASPRKAKVPMSDGKSQ